MREILQWNWGRWWCRVLLRTGGIAVGVTHGYGEWQVDLLVLAVQFGPLDTD